MWLCTTTKLRKMCLKCKLSKIFEQICIYDYILLKKKKNSNVIYYIIVNNHSVSLGVKLDCLNAFYNIQYE
jgi:hypothetical protein